MDKVKEIIDKGRKAEDLLGSEAYQDAVGKVRTAIIDKWSASPLRDVEGQTQLRLMLHLLGSIESNIRQAADDAKVEIETQRQKTLMERMTTGLKAVVS